MNNVGLRCWDENGNITFDSTSRTSMFLGYFDADRKPGSFHDDRLYAGIPFAIPIWYSEDIEDEDDRDRPYRLPGNLPNMSEDGGNGFRWEYDDSRWARGINAKVTFAYGVAPR